MKNMLSIDDCIKIANAQIDANMKGANTKGENVILWASISHHLRQHRAFLVELAKAKQKEEQDAEPRAEDLS